MRVLSFYAADFAICFGLSQDNTMSGIFAIRQKNVLLYEFDGLYHEEDGENKLAFYVDWKSPVHGRVSYSAFSGSVSAENGLQALTLEWMLVQHDHSDFPEFCTSSAPITMTNIIGSTGLVREWPYPNFDKSHQQVTEWFAEGWSQ